MHSCSCWRSGRGRRGDVWESRAALLSWDELEVVHSNVAKDFVASLSGDDNFVIQHRYVQLNSAQGPFSYSMFGGQIPDQFLVSGKFLFKKIVSLSYYFTFFLSSSAISVSILRNFIPASSYIKVLSS